MVFQTSTTFNNESLKIRLRRRGNEKLSKIWSRNAIKTEQFNYIWYKLTNLKKWYLQQGLSKLKSVNFNCFNYLVKLIWLKNVINLKSTSMLGQKNGHSTSNNSTIHWLLSHKLYSHTGICGVQSPRTIDNNFKSAQEISRAHKKFKCLSINDYLHFYFGCICS